MNAKSPNREPGLSMRAVLVLCLVFVLGMFVARLPATVGQIAGQAGFMDPIEDVYRSLMRDYVDKPDEAKLQKGAIDGMLEALDDPYAEYIPPQDRAEFDKQMTGQFVGIGCQIEIRDGWLTVVSPLEDSPALNAGIMANDRITKIEDESTFGLSADECIKRLTGQPKTPVKITVQRDGKETEHTLIRAKINNHATRGFRRLAEDQVVGEGPAGRWEYLIDPDRKIAYVRLSQFTPTAAKEVSDSIAAAKRAAGGQLGGLILDLRNNPGGVMDGALNIADMFIDSGTLMSIEGRSDPKQVFSARKPGTLPEFPMAVLVNEGSASASEIVAGALQDHDRAIVIGTRTYGKGLVQSVRELQSQRKAEVKFTTQRYYVPSGRKIQRSDDSAEWGVDPTPGYFLPMTEEETIAWFTTRRDWDVLRAHEKAAPEVQNWSDPEWIAQTAKDKQLAAAMTAVQTRVASGEWKPVGEDHGAHGKIALTELRTLEKTRDRFMKEFARLEKRIETLETAAATGRSEPERIDLWPDTTDLADGRVRITDKNGREVATLLITGQDLERWLLVADVKPEAETGESAKRSAEPGVDRN